jgi:hypothetical protein
LKPAIARPASRRQTRTYDFTPLHQRSGRFFSGFWPLKILFFPVWLGQKLCRHIFTKRRFMA